MFISKYPIQYNSCCNNLSNSDNEINYSYLNDDNSLDFWYRRLGHYNISSIKDKNSMPYMCKFKDEKKIYQSILKGIRYNV